MESVVKFFPGGASTGAKMLLGAGYFNFIREIPLKRSFEIRFTIGGWDEKWVYLTAVFVSYPKKGSGKDKNKVISTTQLETKPASETSLGDSLVVVPPLTEGVAPTPTDSSAASPSTSNIPLYSEVAGGGAATPAVRPVGAPVPVPIPIPEGAVLHAVAISQYCFKFGRITVP